MWVAASTGEDSIDSLDLKYSILEHHPIFVVDRVPASPQPHSSSMATACPWSVCVSRTCRATLIMTSPALLGAFKERPEGTHWGIILAIRDLVQRDNRTEWWKAQTPESDGSGSQSVCLLPDVWSQANYLAPLFLSFPGPKKEMMIVPAGEGCGED